MMIWKSLCDCRYLQFSFYILWIIRICIHILWNWLTPWSRVLLEMLTGFQLVKKFPAFHGTWRFITTFTSAHHMSLYKWQWLKTKCPRKYLELIGNESFWILLNREQYKLYKLWVTQQVLLKFWWRKSRGKHISSKSMVIECNIIMYHALGY